MTVQHLADQWAARLVEAVSAKPVRTQTINSLETGDPVGRIHLYDGAARIVDVRLVIPELDIDSVMLHAFAPSGSAAPHLVSDLAALKSGWHFHVDLMPRVDLVTETAYLTTVYPPLDDAYADASAIEGATPIAVPGRLRALASPWLVGVIVDPDHATALSDIHYRYQDRFLAHLSGESTAAIDADARQRCDRDRAHRAAMYDAATDEVWDFLATVVGQGPVDDILSAIREPWN